MLCKFTTISDNKCSHKWTSIGKGEKSVGPKSSKCNIRQIKGKKEFYAVQLQKTILKEKLRSPETSGYRLLPKHNCKYCRSSHQLQKCPVYRKIMWGIQEAEQFLESM